MSTNTLDIINMVFSLISQIESGIEIKNIYFYPENKLILNHKN